MRKPAVFREVRHGNELGELVFGELAERMQRAAAQKDGAPIEALLAFAGRGAKATAWSPFNLCAIYMQRPDILRATTYSELPALGRKLKPNVRLASIRVPYEIDSGGKTLQPASGEGYDPTGLGSSFSGGESREAKQAANDQVVVADAADAGASGGPGAKSQEAEPTRRKLIFRRKACVCDLARDTTGPAIREISPDPAGVLALVRAAAGPGQDADASKPAAEVERLLADMIRRKLEDKASREVPNLEEIARAGAYIATISLGVEPAKTFRPDFDAYKESPFEVFASAAKSARWSLEQVENVVLERLEARARSAEQEGQEEEEEEGVGGP